ALNIEIIFEDENITPEMLEGVMVNFTSDTPGFKDSSAPLENVQKDQQRSRGDTTLGDVVVVRELDKSSTKLQLSGSLTLSGGELQRGGLYEEVSIKPIRLELAIAAPGGGGGSSSGGEVPTEDISLNFE